MHIDDKRSGINYLDIISLSVWAQKSINILLVCGMGVLGVWSVTSVDSMRDYGCSRRCTFISWNDVKMGEQ